MNRTLRSFSSVREAFIQFPNNLQLSSDLHRAIDLVKKYDPAGFLPGFLIKTNEAKIGYFASKFGSFLMPLIFKFNVLSDLFILVFELLVRAFWVESGLRFKVDLSNARKNSISNQVVGIGQNNRELSDVERLQEWKEAVQCLYQDSSSSHPTIRLLQSVLEKRSLSQKYFDKILLARELDIDRKQYPTIESLMEHVEMSCGSLFHLILQSGGIDQSDKNSATYQAVHDIGIGHGLANALRTSIPVVSATGKIIIPYDLCQKYGVRSPRYLLSALGMGDEECREHLQNAVGEISKIARDHIANARSRRSEILKYSDGEQVVSTFLPVLASDVFLDRLENHNYDLTDRNLRSVGMIEHLSCSGRQVMGLYKKTY
jgi:phytoene/squalene synthetase